MGAEYITASKLVLCREPGKCILLVYYLKYEVLYSIKKKLVFGVLWIRVIENIFGIYWWYTFGFHF